MSEEQFMAVIGAEPLTEVATSISDCPLCPHPEADHGTYGCLSGWRWGDDGRLVYGCTCARRRLIDHTRSNATRFGLPFPRGTGG